MHASCDSRCPRASCTPARSSAAAAPPAGFSGGDPPLAHSAGPAVPDRSGWLSNSHPTQLLCGCCQSCDCLRWLDRVRTREPSAGIPRVHLHHRARRRQRTPSGRAVRPPKPRQQRPMVCKGRTLPAFLVGPCVYRFVRNHAGQD